MKSTIFHDKTPCNMVEVFFVFRIKQLAPSSEPSNKPCYLGSGARGIVVVKALRYNRKVAGSRPDEFIEIVQFTYSFRPH
jgi:hypothetical protein